MISVVQSVLGPEVCVLETSKKANVKKRKLTDASIQTCDYRLLHKKIRINAPGHSEHGLIGKVCNMVIDGRLVVEIEKTHNLVIIKAAQAQLPRPKDAAEANLTEYLYSMRAVADTGASTHVVCHPKFCAPGSVKEISPVTITGVGGSVTVGHCGDLVMSSNIPGCTATIVLKDVLIMPNAKRTLICIPELDRMGYACTFFQGTLTISLGEDKIFVLPRLPESQGMLLDIEDRMQSIHDLKPFSSGSVNRLYPIPDSCFENSQPSNGKAESQN
jgi:hypothetical protein